MVYLSPSVTYPSTVKACEIPHTISCFILAYVLLPYSSKLYQCIDMEYGICITSAFIWLRLPRSDLMRKKAATRLISGSAVPALAHAQFSYRAARQLERTNIWSWMIYLCLL
jgi:hypothetical protein